MMAPKINSVNEGKLPIRASANVGAYKVK